MERTGVTSSNIQSLGYNCNCAKGHYGVCPHQRLLSGEARGERIRFSG